MQVMVSLGSMHVEGSRKEPRGSSVVGLPCPVCCTRLGAVTLETHEHRSEEVPATTKQPNTIRKTWQALRSQESKSQLVPTARINTPHKATQQCMRSIHTL